MKYDVHVYAVVRYKYEGIEAESHAAAIKIAEKKYWSSEPHGRDADVSEPAEEVVNFLVDEVGDEEYNNTLNYDADGKPWQDGIDPELRRLQLLREAISAFPAFDTDNDPVNGGDLVEWFAQWRERAKQLVAAPVAIDSDPLASAINTANTRSGPGGFPLTDLEKQLVAECERLIAAGKRIMAGENTDADQDAFGEVEDFIENTCDGEDVDDREPIGAVMEDGSFVTPWDERLRAAGGRAVYSIEEAQGR